MRIGRRWWAVVAVALGVGLGLAVLTLPKGQAQGGGTVRLGPEGSEPMAGDAQVAFGAASDESVLGIQSLTGSDVKTRNCYQEDKTQTLCFTVYNGSSDGEWIRQIRLTFPTGEGDWRVACNSALEDPTDSVGYPVDFGCSASEVYEILYVDSAGGWDGISPGASWGTCVDVDVPAGYLGPRPVSWVLTGNGTPAVDISGKTEIEKCTPLTLTPSRKVITGCNGTAQTLEFMLENYGAGDDRDVMISYSATGATFTGETDVTLSEGELVTFTAELKPDLWLEPGDQVVADVTVDGGGHQDSSTITETISENAGWQRRGDTPVLSVDSAVIWASHQDGGLWSIGGYGSGGMAQRYDPASGEWMTYTTSFTPVIEYPVDGCYGLNEEGEEVVVLFPDTIVTGTLQVFNITRGSWSSKAPPTGEPGSADYPEEGRWGHDVVSLLNNPAAEEQGMANRNVCYLSGGAERPGGGTTKDLWEYSPETNTVVNHSPFPGDVWFGFHASWYVPWIGDEGGICVAGGVDHNSQVNSTTQCYDIGAEAFNDADLGTLPEPWWGMADGWRMTQHGYELWIANGVAGDGTVLPASAYFRQGMTNFEYGPPVPDPLYRLEGDGYGDVFFTFNGAWSGLAGSRTSLWLEACPACHKIFLPLTLRDL